MSPNDLLPYDRGWYAGFAVACGFSLAVEIVVGVSRPIHAAAKNGGDC